MRVSKGNAIENKGIVFSHLSAFNPRKTATAKAASNWLPRLANRKKNCLLSIGLLSELFDDGLVFIVIHLNNIGAHMAFTIEGSTGLQLQFTSK